MAFVKRRLTLLLVALFAVSALSVYAKTSGESKSFGLSDDKSSSSEPSIEYITVDDLKTKMEKNESLVVLDVRGSDYDEGKTKIKGAKHFASGKLEANLKDLPKDKLIVTYCGCITDGGSINAARILLNNGFTNVRVLKGGWSAWNKSGGPVEEK